MNKNIYLYLFVFALLLALFMYINSKGIIETYEEKISSFETSEAANKEKIMALEDENLDLSVMPFLVATFLQFCVLLFLLG